MADRVPFSSALVTGASSGIGEAIVRELGREGLPQVVVARRGERLAALADELPALEILVADLTTADGLERVATRVASTVEPIDLVVNNAGFGTSGAFHTLDADRLDREIGLNVRALTRLSHAALGAMVPRGRGHLLNVSSVVSFQPAPKLAVYAATKSYVTQLTESLHEEVRGTGVHVTALCPGLTRTEFQSVSSSSGYAEQYPEWMWTSAEQVARRGLDDVARNRAISVPGVLYRSMVAATGVLPRGVLRRLSGLVQR
ncbi:MAG: SDR family oxidoreductase [Ilumatobacteraceae bacterium]|nr:SDR family oxidoreductase [Acidimicrobiales bacterium]MCB9393075.1 SDR family oxidoreductase [Acidimicrobiaceae bacterium]